MSAPYDLERYITSQDPVLPEVIAELEAGRKRSHWMWFVFPQLSGLGNSAASRRFALSSVDEARAYLAHPVLGPRLLRCIELVLRIPERSASDIFGSPDDTKFRSSMTLFAAARPGEPLFMAALGRFFGGKPDERTLALLEVAASGDTELEAAP